ncbi:hypothetical protein V7O62_02205 [Methanolobus sp. ZRKC2]|uniref:hypothetical protein n=1 Tax=Methanolobus sp. ZRKC2 TaxID=3125783 RepID=UPI0032546EF6
MQAALESDFEAIRSKEIRAHKRKYSKKSQSDLDHGFEEKFDPKNSILNTGNFVIPGQGEKPDYCHVPFLSHVHESGDGGIEMIISCKQWRCPCCYRLKVDSEVFKYAVLLEAYSKVTGDRPFRAVASISTDQAYKMTLEDLRSFWRNAKDRLRRCGVNAGFKLSHPFRIKKNVQEALRILLGSNTSSGGFWDFILSGQSAIDSINDYLGSDYKTWRDLVNFSPHVHYLLFPDHQKISGDKNIILTKLQAADGSYTLDSVDDVVRHLRYLVTHTGVLCNVGSHDNRVKPAGVFGDLFRWDPSDYLTTEEIQEIQSSVLDILNEKRTRPYTVDIDGELCYLDDEDSISDETLEERGLIKINKLRAHDAISAESVDAWLASIENQDNRAYVEYLLSEYSRILDDDDIPQKMRRLFLKDLRDPPDSFKITTLDV